jgi:hypothetical protein
MNERYQASVKVIATWYEDKKYTKKKKYDPKNDWNPKLFIVKINLSVPFFVAKSDFV